MLTQVLEEAAVEGRAVEEEAAAILEAVVGRAAAAVARSYVLTQRSLMQGPNMKAMATSKSHGSPLQREIQIGMRCAAA